MGVVYAPVIKKLWYGLKDYGSFFIENKERPVKIKKVKPDNNIVKIVSSRSHANNKKLKDYLKQFKNYEIISMGSSI